MDINNYDIKNRVDKPFKLTNIFITLVILVLFFVFSNYLFSAPKNNNKATLIHIYTNESLSSVANNFKKENIIRSDFFLKFFTTIFKSDKKIDEGDYLFNKDSSVFVIAWQLARGKHNVNPMKITLREGLTNNQMANIFAKDIPNFQKELFLKKVNGMQGYLFPDTYFFYQLDTINEIVGQLSNNFNNHINKINTLINKSDKKLKSIIIMASIIEKEAHGKEDASIISGILWKRLRLGIPLQVDADKSTYKTKGLPINPICNPGLRSIMASLKPTSSPYFYYLHDKNGIAHFAKTYKEHKRNIVLYLK